MSSRTPPLDVLEREIESCRACPRLVRWREDCAHAARRPKSDGVYWSRPVPAFGPTNARLLVLGLAPGAHGANRTGRPFTGDGAGEFLYAALFRAGLSNRAVSLARDDGLRLRGLRISNAVRCAPPGNQPSRAEAIRCAGHLRRELELLPRLRVILCLGQFAWKAALSALDAGPARFGHGVRTQAAGLDLFGSYHTSRLNTRTGRLTPRMFDSVLAEAWERCGAR